MILLILLQLTTVAGKLFHKIIVEGKLYIESRYVLVPRELLVYSYTKIMRSTLNNVILDGILRGYIH